MSSPNLIFRRPSPSPDGRPPSIELDFASPPILRAHPHPHPHTQHSRPTPIPQPALSRSVDSETSSVSETLRPYPRPRLASPSAEAESPDQTMPLGSAEQSPSSNLPTGSRRAKSFSPHTGDLLGSSSEASTSQASSRRQSPLNVMIDIPPSQDRDRRPNFNNLLRHNSSASPSPRSSTSSIVTSVSNNTGNNNINPHSRRCPYESAPFPNPLGPYMRRRIPTPVIRPRVDPEPAHLADFDRRNVGGFNELGLPSRNFTPTAFRPRPEFAPDANSNSPTQTDPTAPEPEAESPSPSPPPSSASLAPLQAPRSTTNPVAISTAPATPPFQRRDSGTSSENPEPNIFLAYGLTGNLLRDQANAVTPDTTTTTDAPSAPSVPPPRPSRLRLIDAPLEPRDRIDFSPPRLSSRSREPSGGSSRMDIDTPEDSSNEIRSRLVQERLSRLDALRTHQADGRFGSAPSASNPYWANRSAWGLIGFSQYPHNDPLAQPHLHSHPQSQAQDTSSRLGRYNLDDPRDLRSRPRRRLSISDTDTQLSDSGSEINRWNRNVHEAVVRRVAAESPFPSASSRGHELGRPYLRPSASARSTGREDEEPIEPYAQPQPPRPPASGLWGEIPVNTTDARSPPVRTAFGWRDLSAITDPIARWEMQSDLTERRDTEPSVAQMNHHYIFGGLIPGQQYPFASPYHQIPVGAGVGEGLDYYPQLSRVDVLNHLRLNSDMDEKEKARVVKIITRTVGLWPSHVRQKAAESMVKSVKWAEMGEVDGMERDVYCSVCHDEYEDGSDITITPCKHMYHKGCLETWIQTPNTSTCPMCRRDLAVLACMTKVTPENKEDALPLWMSM